MMNSHVVLVLAAFLASACGGVSNRIVGGNTAAEGKYPYQAYLKDGQGYLCGAAILHRRYVLTAAHCLALTSVSGLKVVVGTNHLNDESAQVLPVESFTIHEDYHRPNNDHGVNDIGVVRLKKNILFNDKVQPVKLPNSNFTVADNTALTFTGWGALKYTGSFFNDLQEIQLKVFNQLACKREWLGLKLILIEDSMLCTAGTRGYGVCYGDSGSPLTAGDVLVGISSFGYPCALGRSDIFTRITSYVDWINEFLE